MDALTPYLLVVIMLMGSPVYRVRVNAFNHLYRLDTLPIHLLMISENHPDKEISSRSKLLVDRFFEKHAEEIVKTLKPDGWTIYPWIITQNDDGKYQYTTLNSYMEGLRSENFEDKSPLFPMWSEATKRYLIDCVKQRKDTGSILAIFIHYHREWCLKSRPSSSLFNVRWPIP